jgi:cyclase
MKQERVTEDIYVFISGLYAEVSATVILTRDGAVVVDTLPFPSETEQIRAFVHQRTPGGVRYVINTHHHADHVYGSYLFPEAELIAHRRCRELLLKLGEESLAHAKVQTPELEAVELRIPKLVFEEELLIRLGDKTIDLLYAPGHTPDSLVVHAREDKVLIAGDLVTPVPLLVRGDGEDMTRSLRMLRPLGLENIVQGHGDVLLRGEVDETIDASIRYIRCVERRVREFIESGRSRADLKEIEIETCGRSRIPLGGLVQRFHVANLQSEYDRLVDEMGS